MAASRVRTTVLALLIWRVQSFAPTTTRSHRRVHRPNGFQPAFRRPHSKLMTERTHMHSKLSKLISGSNPRRPGWAAPWMPTWLVSMRPTTQLAVGFGLYMFHLVFLTKRCIVFPVQLIRNSRGHFQSVGLDTLAGIASLASYLLARQRQLNIRKVAEEKQKNAKVVLDAKGTQEYIAIKKEQIENEQFVLPDLLSVPKVKEVPWKQIYESAYARRSSVFALVALLFAYDKTGDISIWWENSMYELANYLPMTVAMHRSLCILLGHVSWVGMGAVILRVFLRPRFFEKWFTNERSDTQWLWWTMGGYFVSAWLFNVADFVNQYALPIPILERAADSMVTQLVTPEFSDILASLVGCIAPCITAPWWEEILYRGFLLPALMLQMKYRWAILVSGLIFSLHHMSGVAFIPLAVLGWTWNLIYAKSGNLNVTILIHAMWNSRVFLESWLGL